MRIPILIILLALMAVGCRRGHDEARPGAVYAWGEYAVYADSIVSGDRVYKPRSDSIAAPGMPRYGSGMGVADALFSRAVCGIDTAAADGLTTAQLAYAVHMSLAVTCPERAMELLRSRVRGTRVVDALQYGTPWPVATDGLAWILGAWEVYAATGSRRWLDECLPVVEGMLHGCMTAAWDRRYMLLHGCPTETLGAVGPYPAWMGAVDKYESMCLVDNVLAVAALRAGAAMTRIAGRSGDDYDASAAALQSSINDRLWMPVRGYYSQYLYGCPYAIQSEATDNLGQGLALVLGVADRRRARSVVARTPLLQRGITSVYPAPSGWDASEPAPPHVQAYWCMGAASVANMTALTASMGALMLSEASGSTDGLMQRAAMTAMVMRVITGVSLTDSSMRFDPVVPASMPGVKRLSGLRYCGATLDVTVSGTGTAVASFMVDGEASPTREVPRTLIGHHTVDIKMAGNSPAMHQTVTAGEAASMPQTPTLRWLSARHVSMVGYSGDERYRVWVNGSERGEVSGDDYRLGPTDGFTTVAIVPVSDSGVAGYAARPRFLIPQGAEVRVPAVEHPVRWRPGTRLITDRRAAARVVEMSRRRHRHVTFRVEVPSDGEWFVDARYANASGSPMVQGALCPMRSLSVDGECRGVLLMPRTGRGWRRQAFSSMLCVRLDSGRSIITLDHMHPDVVPESCSSDTILVEYLRLIKK